jgi:hypothetical protein
MRGSPGAMKLLHNSMKPISISRLQQGLSGRLRRLFHQGNFIPAYPRLEKPCHHHGVLSRIHRKTLAARQGWRSTGNLVAFDWGLRTSGGPEGEPSENGSPPSFWAGVPVGHTCRDKTIVPRQRIRSRGL